MYSYVFVCQCTHVYRYVEQSEKGIRSSGAVVTSGSESPNMLVGNQTQVSGKSDHSYPMSYLSSPAEFRRSCPDPPLAHIIRSGGRGGGGTEGRVRSRNTCMKNEDLQYRERETP